ncbi:MAG TPA: apolipoprotein N-acyltransferase, partial [Flavobacteriaceae bacterium]|nr:apolipoprotein N-acyltransferase [Flavobacteriaceae bacterium]
MKNSFLALLSGILLALSWPTYGFPGLLFFAFVPLLLAERALRGKNPKKSGWRVFGLAYVSFFIWNLIATYWLYFSTPFGMWFAILANSLLMSLVFLIYHFVAKRTKFGAACTFLVVLWISFEYLHLHWEFSWPWLNLGNAFSEYFKWIQWYEYTGTFGGTLWVWLVNIGIFKTVLLYRKYRAKSIIYWSILKNGLLILVPILISWFILENYSIDESKKTEVVILQPNIDPYTEKYNTTDKRIGILLNDLAKTTVDYNTNLVIAPETVFADGTKLNQFEYSPGYFYSKEMISENPKLNFLGGISMYSVFHDREKIRKQTNQLKPGVWYDDYNAAFLMNNQTDSTQFYYKSKLVVGVENFPYQGFLKPILGDVMIDLGGTVAMKTTQSEREVFVTNNSVKIAPIICYESVYGEYVTGYVKNGAQVLAIITNDAWWGDTQGHKQHLSYARLRAIETRRSVARSANTGISAFINSKGEIISSLGYEKMGSLKENVILNSEKTFYVQHGDYIARIALFLAAFIFLFATVKKRTDF